MSIIKNSLGSKHFLLQCSMLTLLIVNAVKKFILGQPEYLRHHVIRCQNSKAYYFGDKDKGIRLNVVVQLSKPQPGTDSVREMYQFMCKNSCPSGMNRKPIEVIFTLEDESSAVLGRRVLCVRICSCPKRDKEKEEKEVVNKDKESTPHGKKRKMNDHKKASANVETPVDTKELVVNVCFVLCACCCKMF